MQPWNKQLFKSDFSFMDYNNITIRRREWTSANGALALIYVVFRLSSFCKPSIFFFTSLRDLRNGVPLNLFVSFISDSVNHIDIFPWFIKHFTFHFIIAPISLAVAIELLLSRPCMHSDCSSFTLFFFSYWKEQSQ